MPISIPILARRAIGNIIDPEDITKIVDAVEILADAFTDVEETVPGLVEDALANDEVLQAAIETGIEDQDIPQKVEDAVDAEILGREIPDVTGIIDDDVRVGMAFSDGKRTFIEADTDGKPTAWSAELISEAIGGEAIPQLYGFPGDIAFAIPFSDGKRSFLEFDGDGLPTEWSAGLIGDALGLDGGATFPIMPTQDWSHWGDSITAGAGWVSTLSGLTGQTHYNGGIGGQVSEEIAARQGGHAVRLTLTGNQIPGTTTSVAVTAITATPLSNQLASMTGTLAGVPGTLAWTYPTMGSHTFTRTTAGSAVDVYPREPFIPDNSQASRICNITAWLGRNDHYYGYPERVVPMIRQIIGYQSTDVVRALVLEVMPSAIGTPEAHGTAGRDDLDALNDEIQAAFPNEWVPMASWLRTEEAADAAGVTFDATDLSDIEDGLTPTVFTSDGLHPNSTGGVAIAARLYAEMTTRGWI